MHYRTIAEVKLANHASGYHWFEPGTMRFFRSRIAPGVIGGRYFISSEQFDDGSPRLYTVREARPDGSIEDASEFQEFTTLAAARRHAHALTRESPL